jgi:hypothetical protein
MQTQTQTQKRKKVTKLSQTHIRLSISLPLCPFVHSSVTITSAFIVKEIPNLSFPLKYKLALIFLYTLIGLAKEQYFV